MGQIGRQISAVIAMAVGAVLLPVLTTTKATANGSAQVTDIRVGNHKNKTRLVLDVTKPVDLRYEVSADGNAVFIDLPRIKWSADPFKERHFKGLINDFKFSPEAAGGRFNILTNGPVRIRKPFFVPPKGRLGHRIVIDIMKDRSATLMAKQKSEGTLQMRRTTSPAQPPPLETDRMVAGPGAIPQSAPPLPKEPIVAGHERREHQVAERRQPVSARQHAADQMRRQTPRPMPLRKNTTRRQGHGGILGFKNIYLKGQTGIAITPEITNSGAGNENTMELDPGFSLTGGLGFDLENNFRVEGEMAYSANSIAVVRGAGNGSSFNTTYTGGDISSLAFMGNLAYDFPAQSRFTPYFMGGVGLVGIFANDIKADGTVISDSSDFVFGMQLGAGASLPLDDVTTLEAAYRYMETQDPEFGDQRGIPFTSEISSHSLVLGVRLKF